MAKKNRSEVLNLAKKNLSEALDLADSLAKFANLGPGEGVRFLKDHPNFAPAWWNGAAMNESGAFTPIWQKEQHKIREAWRMDFPPESLIQLIAASSNLAEYKDERFLKLDNMNEAALEEAMSSPKRRAYDYQLALMFLHDLPWRAAVCPGAKNRPCGKYFVKVEKRTVYCGEACSNANRSEDKMNWWLKTGSKLRAKKNKEKKKPNRRQRA